MNQRLFEPLFAEMGERCTFRDSDDCSFTFSYKENPGKDIKIFVQKEKGTNDFFESKNEIFCLVIVSAQGIIQQSIWAGDLSL